MLPRPAAHPPHPKAPKAPTVPSSELLVPATALWLPDLALSGRGKKAVRGAGGWLVLCVCVV